MNAATERNIRSAFVLTNQDIQKLANSLQSFVGTPAFEIARRDGISRSFNDISSFLAFDNSRSKAIRSLWMSARSEDMKVAFHTGLAQRLRPFVSIFRGGEDTVSGLTDAILDRIDGMRPWFSSVARIDFTLLGFVTLFVAFGVLCAVAALGLAGHSSHSPTENDPRASAIAFLVIFGCFGLIIGGGWLLNRLRAAVFLLRRSR